MYWKIIIVVILLTIRIASAECLLNCMFQPGTVCINDVCVPLPKEKKNVDIKLPAVPLSQIVPVEIDCLNVDFSTLKVFLIKSIPPGQTSFYSVITTPDGKAWVAEKDILNRYVFIENATKEQFKGEDFNWTSWENKAFTEIFKQKTCAELKTLGWVFTYGVLSEGASFKFK